MALLRRKLDAAWRGDGGFVLLAGDPGIGKTRLAEQLVHEATERGAFGLIGRCYEGEGAPAYWPWVMVLRDLAARAGVREVRAWLGSNAALVGRVAPEVVGTPAIGTMPDDSDSVRFRFFDAVAGLLARAAGEQPLIVFIDDLHWADEASLRLLHFAARQLTRARIFFVGTHRDVEMRRGADATLRTALARVGERLQLDGLGPDEVGGVIRSILAADQPRAFVERVHEVSEGNPFFVDALVRVIASSDERTWRVPEGVRDVIRARLRPLGTDAYRLLAIAAVIGREFAPGLLARVAAVDAATVTTAIQEAEDLELLGGRGERRRFAHALIPETLAGDLPALERATIHHRVAQAMAPLAAAGAVSFDEVAMHYLAAVPVGATEDAITYAAGAAERAIARLGYEDAVRYYRRALAVFEGTAVNAPTRHVELLLALGDAERRLGDASAARATFERAGALAADAGLADQLARAALGYGAGLGAIWDQGLGRLDDVRVRLVKQALAAVGPEPSAIRAMLLAHLAASLFWSGARESRHVVEQLGRDALEMARTACGSIDELAVEASVHWTSSGPDDPAGRLGRAERIVAQATALRQPELLLRGRMYAAVHHLELGHVGDADREIEQFNDAAHELGQRHQLWYVCLYRGMRAHMAGRYDDVERTAAEGLALAERAQPLAAPVAFGGQIAMVRREQGRVAETIAPLREYARQAPGMPVLGCVVASALADAGELTDARTALEHVARDGFATLPRDFLWLYAMTNLARTCAALADVDRARTLYDLLVPYADHVAVAQHGVLCDGAVARYLGLLATTLERWDDASRHFDAALTLNRRLGAWTFLTATQQEYAVVLLRRGESARAHELLRSARLDAARAGQVALLAKIDAMGHVPAIGTRAGEACALRREGEVWAVTYEGRTARLKTLKGFGYLARLVTDPGREFHVLDLVDLEQAPPDGVAAARDGDLGPVLDRRAKAELHERLRDLRTTIDEAEANNDPERARRAHEEIELIGDELARAMGLAGRDRPTGSSAERARASVTKALRAAIRAIATPHPSLADLLSRTIRTGTFCSYDPMAEVPVTWTVA